MSRHLIFGLAPTLIAAVGAASCDRSTSSPGQQSTREPSSESEIEARFLDERPYEDEGGVPRTPPLAQRLSDRAEPVRTRETVCAPSSLPTPIRRISQQFYRTLVAEEFGVTAETLVLPEDGSEHSAFTLAALNQSVSPVAVEQYSNAAENLSSLIVAASGTWSGCDFATTANEECASVVLRTGAEKLFRRTLREEEMQRLSTAYSSLAGAFSPLEAVEMVMQSLLESPNFLYFVEGEGADIAGGTKQLTASELAARLAMLIRKGPPDATLRSLAESGQLLNDDVLASEVDRLLERYGNTGVLAFYGEWLRLKRLETAELDQSIFPEFNETLRQDLRTSVDLYLDHLLSADATFSELHQSNAVYVNERLATLLGIESTASGFAEATAEATQYGGILTQPAWLASTSHGIQHSAIFRGVSLLSDVLCTPTPAAPPGILDNVELPPSEVEVCTTREYIVETHTRGADCRACHDAIDGAGFVFENYDALGRFRSEENGCAVDASGTFPTTDLEFYGQIAGGVQLGENLARSKDAARCFASKWLEFTLGQKSFTADECLVRQLSEDLLAGDVGLRGVVKQIVLSRAFREMRP